MIEITPSSTPNRWVTRVTVELTTDQRTRYYGFPDLQLAYMWVEDYIGTETDWDLIPFRTVADDLDASCEEKGIRLGYACIAQTSSTQITVSYGQLVF